MRNRQVLKSASQPAHKAPQVTHAAGSPSRHASTVEHVPTRDVNRRNARGSGGYDVQRPTCEGRPPWSPSVGSSRNGSRSSTPARRDFGTPVKDGSMSGSARRPSRRSKSPSLSPQPVRNPCATSPRRQELASCLAEVLPRINTAMDVLRRGGVSAEDTQNFAALASALGPVADNIANFCGKPGSREQRRPNEPPVHPHTNGRSDKKSFDQHATPHQRIEFDVSACRAETGSVPAELAALRMRNSRLEHELGELRTQVARRLDAAAHEIAASRKEAQGAREDAAKLSQQFALLRAALFRRDGADRLEGQTISAVPVELAALEGFSTAAGGAASVIASVAQGHDHAQGSSFVPARPDLGNVGIQPVSSLGASGAIHASSGVNNAAVTVPPLVIPGVAGAPVSPDHAGHHSIPRTRGEHSGSSSTDEEC